MASKRSTLADVAREAGVSVATASKVFNGRADVADSTRVRVKKAARDLGYQGKSSNRRSTRTSVEFIADRITSPFAMEILRGVTLAAEELDIDVVVGRFQPTLPSGDGSFVERAMRAGRTGAIIITAQLNAQTAQDIHESGFPVVFVDPLKVADEQIISVGSTSWNGGHSAAEHLALLGHTTIGVVGGPAESSSACARVDGFRSALHGRGITLEDNSITRCGFNYEEACEAAEQLLRLTPRPTAIFASNDIQALGVLEAARKAGLKVPQDLSLIAYDDTYLAAWATPPLTAVYQPLQDIGRVALRTIMQLDAGEALDSHHIELATRLNVRESTAPPHS